MLRYIWAIITFNYEIEYRYIYDAISNLLPDRNFMNVGMWDCYPKVFPGLRLVQYLIEKLNIDSQNTILTVGCGTGDFELLLYKQKKTKKILGIDINKKFIKKAVERVGRIEMENKIEFKVMNACKLKEEVKEYDCVISIELIQDVIEQKIFFSGVYNALSRNGKYYGLEYHIKKKPRNIKDIFCLYTSKVCFLDFMKSKTMYQKILKERGFSNIYFEELTDKTIAPVLNVAASDNYSDKLYKMRYNIVFRKFWYFVVKSMQYCVKRDMIGYSLITAQKA
jgi:ubiquinone/menaquinone biosynthesis C-methylase UbiE